MLNRFDDSTPDDGCGADPAGRAEELGPQLGYLLEKDKAHLADNLMRMNRMLARYPDKVAAYQMLQSPGPLCRRRRSTLRAGDSGLSCR